MNIALILSGGTGVRLGSDIPKQYIEVNGWPIIAYCFAQLAAHERIDAIQIVADAGWRDMLLERLAALDRQKKLRGFSEPGRNRQLSIYKGLVDISAYSSMDDSVFIHDAARPLLSERMITECLNAAQEHDGALPVLPMKDTVYTSLDGRRIHSLLDRSTVYAGQAPEVFILGKYLEANKQLLPEEILKINGSTEPAILAGMDIAMLPGDEMNFKITTKEDLERFQGTVGTKGPEQRLE